MYGIEKYTLKLQLENLADDTVGWILKLHLSDELLFNYTTTKSEIDINNLAYSASYVLEIFTGNCPDEMNSTILDIYEGKLFHSRTRTWLFSLPQLVAVLHHLQ